MKKVLFHILTCVSSFSVISAYAGGPEVIVQPDYFSGFFVGGTGAFHMAGFDGVANVTASTNIDMTGVFSNGFVFRETMFPAGTLMTHDVDVNSFDGYYGVQGGIGKVFNHRWYVGVVGFGEWGSQSATDNNLSTSGEAFFEVDVPPLPYPSETFETTYTSATTVKISNDYGVAFKPGFLVGPTSMVYGKIGAVWANIKVSNTVTGVVTVESLIPDTGQVTTSRSASFSGFSSEENNKVALLLGIGFEQFVYKDIITVNVEYNYANYGSVTTSTQLTPQGTLRNNFSPTFSPTSVTSSLPGSIISQASASAKVSTLLGGINFYFGSRWF